MTGSAYGRCSVCVTEYEYFTCCCASSANDLYQQQLSWAVSIGKTPPPVAGFRVPFMTDSPAVFYRQRNLGAHCQIRVLLLWGLWGLKPGHWRRTGASRRLPSWRIGRVTTVQGTVSQSLDRKSNNLPGLFSSSQYNSNEHEHNIVLQCIVKENFNSPFLYLVYSITGNPSSSKYTATPFLNEYCNAAQILPASNASSG